MYIVCNTCFQFSIVETVLTGLIDEFPWISKSRKRTIMFRAGACIMGFLLGLPMVTEVR